MLHPNYPCLDLCFPLHYCHSSFPPFLICDPANCLHFTKRYILLIFVSLPLHMPFLLPLYPKLGSLAESFSPFKIIIELSCRLELASLSFFFKLCRVLSLLSWHLQLSAFCFQSLVLFGLSSWHNDCTCSVIK